MSRASHVLAELLRRVGARPRRNRRELYTAFHSSFANYTGSPERTIVKLVISSDHAGFALKEELRADLAKAGHEVVDLGAFVCEP